MIKKIKISSRALVVERVEAWACGQCEGVYRDEDLARSCCTCVVCHTKFPRGVTSACGWCSHRVRLAEARADVRNKRRDLRYAEKLLAFLLKTKRPLRGSAPA